MRKTAILLVVLLLPSTATSQSLRELARQRGGEATNSLDCDTGAGLPGQLIAEATVILRGVVSEVRSKLLEDASFVATEYTIMPSHVLRQPSEWNHEPSKLVVRHVGGTVIENALRMSTSTNLYPESERLALGDDVILFLIASPTTKDIYHSVDGPSGAFKVQDGKVVAMTNEAAARRGDVPIDVDDFMRSLVEALR